MHSQPISDRELYDCDLIAKVAIADDAAFAELYARYHIATFNLAVRMVGDVQTAEDIVQVVFLTLWRSPQQFRSGSVRSWLFVITANRARDALRQLKTSRRRDAAIASIEPVTCAVSDEVIGDLEAARIRAAVRRLPAHQRSLIELGFFEFRTHDELARLSGLPLGTVKTRIRSGLRSLRRAIEPDPPSGDTIHPSLSTEMAL